MLRSAAGNYVHSERVRGSAYYAPLKQLVVIDNKETRGAPLTSRPRAGDPPAPATSVMTALTGESRTRYE
jgi:hypothetical protein